MLTDTEIIILGTFAGLVILILGVAIVIVKYCSSRREQPDSHGRPRRNSDSGSSNNPRSPRSRVITFRRRGLVGRRNFRHANVGSPSDSDSQSTPQSPEVETPVATIVQIIHQNNASNRHSNRYVHRVVYPEQHVTESGSDDNRITVNEARQQVPFAENIL